MGYFKSGGAARSAAALITLALATTGAAAQEQATPAPTPEAASPVAPPTLADFLVMRPPSASKFAAAFPIRAMEMGVDGFTDLTCVTREGGLIGDCVVVTERPTGYGFASAHLKLVKHYRFFEADRKTPAKPGKQVRIPARWSAR